jgi:hypothetical protein
VTACSDHNTNYVVRVNPAQLNSDNMYQSSKVQDVLFDAQESNFDSLRAASRQLFLKGVDALKNKKQLGDAIEFFKQSLFVLPDAKTYFELGNALLACKGGYVTNHEAGEAFQVAEDLEYSPIAEVYYLEAVAANLIRKEDDAGYEISSYLIRAIASGFSDSSRIVNDARLESFVTSKLFSEVRESFRQAQFADEDESKFNLYTNCFPEALNGVFEITPDKCNAEGYNNSISYSFVNFIPEMESSSFGRDVSNDFIAIAKLSENSKYTALLYASVSYFGGDVQPVYIKLVTYSKTGELIDGKIFAGQFSAERIKSGRFEGNTFTVQELKRLWNLPIDQVSFENNAVKGYESVSKAVYVINDNGTIKEESTSGNFKDSIILVNN